MAIVLYTKYASEVLMLSMLHGEEHSEQRSWSAAALASGFPETVFVYTDLDERGREYLTTHHYCCHHWKEA